MMEGMNRNLGFTVWESLVILAIIALIAAVAIPSYVKFLNGRDESQQNACIGNMRRIDSGKEQWAMANNLSNGCPVVAASVNEYIAGTMPRYVWQEGHTLTATSAQTPNAAE
jgi:Tfp pilus assembly protein PilE